MNDFVSSNYTVLSNNINSESKNEHMHVPSEQRMQIFAIIYLYIRNHLLYISVEHLNLEQFTIDVFGFNY